MVFSALMIGAPMATSAEKKTAKKPAAKSSASKSSTRKKQPKLKTLSENQKQRNKVRQDRINASGKVSALKDEDKRVEQNLTALVDDVKDQSAALGNAKRQLAQAEQEVAEAQAVLSETSAAIKALDGQRQTAALKAYVQPQSARVASMLNAKDLAAVSTSQVYIEIANRSQADDIDKLRAAEEDRQIALTKAAKAEKRRAERRKAAARRLIELREARARTERYSGDVEEKLERALAEAESLALVDKQLAKEIAKQQDAIARQLAAAQRSGVKGKDGKIKNVPVGALGSTNGIQVAASLRPKLAALLRAAAADGIILSGGGYRSSAGQIAVRKRNCGSSSYAIYQMRSSSCRPPTARPGTSQHERGLAIDFTQNGRALRRSSSGYVWLRNNAHKYGLYNLPSEPWHWSTTGR